MALKANEGLQDVFQRNCLWFVLETRLTDRISNSRLHEQCDSILLPRAIVKQRLRWLGHFVRMKDDIVLKILLFGHLSGAEQEKVILVFGGRMS